MQLIKSIDIFGVPLQLSIQRKDKLFQSPLGGLTTIFIYLISAAYSIQLLYMWFSQSLAPSVVVQTTQIIDGDRIQLEHSTYRLSLVATIDGPKLAQITENKTLFNSAYIVADGSISSMLERLKPIPPTNCSRDPSTFYLFNSLCQNISDSSQNILHQSTNPTKNTGILYLTFFCNKTLDENCIRDEILQFQEFLSWNLTLFRQDVDLSTGDVFELSESYYFPVYADTSQHLIIDIEVIKATVSIDNGVIFSNPQTFEIVKNVIPKIEYSWSNKFDLGPMIQVASGGYTYSISISFPSITLILSQIISFFQTLVLFGWCTNYFNQIKMEKYIKDTLVQIYFPQYQKVRVEQNLLGSTQSVYYNDVKTSELVKTLLLSNRKRIEELAQSRLNLFHLIKDLNQVQTAISLAYQKPQVRSYQLSFLESLDTTQNNHQLTEQDFYNLFDPNDSKQRRSECNKTYPITVDIDRPPDSQNNEGEVFDLESALRTNQLFKYDRNKTSS